MEQKVHTLRWRPMITAVAGMSVARMSMIWTNRLLYERSLRLQMLTKVAGAGLAPCSWQSGTAAVLACQHVWQSFRCTCCAGQLRDLPSGQLLSCCAL